MDKRHELHAKLKSITPNVYFVEKDRIQLTYPCIVYSRTRPNVVKANNKAYTRHRGYNVTYIDTRPNTVDDKMDDIFDYCSLSTQYVSDGLYHETYLLYYDS